MSSLSPQGPPAKRPRRSTAAELLRKQALDDLTVKIHDCALAPSKLDAQEVPLTFMILLGQCREQWVEKLKASTPSLETKHENGDVHLKTLSALEMFTEFVSVGDEQGCYPYFQDFFLGIPAVALVYEGSGPDKAAITPRT